METAANKPSPLPPAARTPTFAIAAILKKLDPPSQLKHTPHHDDSITVTCHETSPFGQTKIGKHMKHSCAHTCIMRLNCFHALSAPSLDSALPNLANMRSTLLFILLSCNWECSQMSSNAAYVTCFATLWHRAWAWLLEKRAMAGNLGFTSGVVCLNKFMVQRFAFLMVCFNKFLTVGSKFTYRLHVKTSDPRISSQQFHCWQQVHPQVTWQNLSPQDCISRMHALQTWGQDTTGQDRTGLVDYHSKHTHSY